MFEMTSTLASTGSDSLVLFFIIGGLLLAVGIGLIIFRALRRRGGAAGPKNAEQADNEDIQS